ncbi:15608_t:CDS:10 [Funneliformis geosporum]|uniref:225_t:CDS:1 n=1 Tax=Funneliformis geosporum TaxID=1117311 RepID=A0A9W4SPG6_9GLOM|nr:15608_t:CDS:10 [Funneliformis geosporum]CAI2176866.1 225_t:CDS:10 [Funneliformis geosporum]
MITQDPAKLEKLLKFAKKGGIGTCVANQDIIAHSEDDLMFYAGEVITVLKRIKDDLYLGYCKDVIGIFNGKAVDFNEPLKIPRSLRLERPSSKISSIYSFDQSSSHQASFLYPSDTTRSTQSSNESILGLSGIGNNSTPSSPIIKIIPATSEINYNNNSSLSLNQSNVPRVIPSPRKSSISSEHSIPLSPHKQSTMPYLSNNPEPIMPLSKSRQSLINGQNQSNHSDSSNNDTRKPQNFTTIIPGKSQNNMQSVTIGQQHILGMSIDPVPHRIVTSKSRDDHYRSGSISNSDISSQSSSLASSPVSIYNKGRSQVFGSPLNSPTSPKSIQYKSRNPIFNISNGASMVNGSITSDSISSPPRSPFGRNSPSPIPQRKFSIATTIGHDSPSTTPLPSPKLTQIKVIQEEQILLDGRYSTSTTPLPSPRFIPRNMINNNNNHQFGSSEGRVTSANTPAPTPVIITPKITLEDSDIDDSDDDQEESLIAYASSSNNSTKSSSSNNPSKTTEVPALKVENASDSISDTPSEQLSTNESEEISSEDDKVEEKNESESGETQSNKSAKKEKNENLTIDEYGFVRDVTEEDIPPGVDRIQRIIQAPGTEEKSTRTIRLYREREVKWIDLFGSMDSTMVQDSRKIKKLVRSGIPESVRGKAWQFMAGANKYRKPGVFDELRNRPKLPIYDVIERDIHRCYPDHIQFREEAGFGQDDLHNILKAYAHYNPEVGYCQGMGRLVGMMLMQMPAEDTFWLLVATIEEYMIGYFTPTLSQVRIDSMVFEQLLADHDSKLAQHLAENDILPLMYITQWFMTIFTMALPWASVLRVWDIFYFEGVKLFFRIGLAIMDCTRERLLKTCPTNSEILGFLLHIPHDLLTPDLLLGAAFKIRLKRSTIRRITKRFNAVENNNEVGSDSASVNTTGVNKETRRGLMKKSRSIDKLKIDGIEFKLVGE